NVGVRAAEQQHVRPKSVAPSEDGEVLPNDRLEERCHELWRSHTHFLQGIYVGLGENAALACYRVQLETVVAHFAELLGGNPKLGVDLVDDRSGAACTLVVHRWDLLLFACLRVFLEDNDLRILPAKLDHRT